MVELMREAAEPLLRKWEACIIEAEGDGEAAEIEVGEDLRTMSAEVISRACFGSSYSKGKHIFLKLRTLQKLISNQGFLFRRPSFRFLNPKCQMEIRSLEKEIERLIWKAVEERVEECCGTGSADKDLLQLILDGALQDEGGNLGKTHSSTSKRSFIVDNCKNIYFAGHESTAVAASWCLMLLALHPEWQHRIRSEVDQVSLDDADSILKIKSGMVELMREAAEPLLRKWEACIIEAEGDGEAAEIEVGEDLRTMSAEVISRACFGSSYSKGKHIFLKLRTLQKLISNQGFLFRRPSFRFLNPKCQMEIRSLEKEIERLIWKAVEERVEECCGTGSADKDLLQLILDGALQDEGGNLGKTHSSASKRSFIVDNCKNIYFAGHESTAVAASWCLMLLALHPEWQHRIRSEVDQVSLDDADSILKIKSVTMVIQEALRLYPPAAFISREALEEIEIGGIVVPKGVCVWTLIPTLHRDPEIWGPDANQFNPERFADGLSNACRVPQAYVPFGVGARLCLGRNFAMFQLKIILCLVVSKFSFSLSPRYKHAPAYRMIVEPGNGVHILVRNNEATYKADA